MLSNRGSHDVFIFLRSLAVPFSFAIHPSTKRHYAISIGLLCISWFEDSDAFVVPGWRKRQRVWWGEGLGVRVGLDRGVVGDGD